MKAINFIKSFFSDYPEKTMKKQIVSLSLTVALTAGALLFIFSRINFDSSALAAARSGGTQGEAANALEITPVLNEEPVSELASISEEIPIRTDYKDVLAALKGLYVYESYPYQSFVYSPDFSYDIEYDGVVGASTAGGSGSGGSKTASTTTIQVEGIDEGDCVKVQGDYVYFLSDDEKKSVKIIKATGDMLLTAAINPQNDTEFFEEIYVKDNLLVIIGHIHKYQDYPSTDDQLALDIYHYGYGNQKVFAKIYDISNKSNPRLINNYSQEGFFISTRLSGNTLYLISNAQKCYTEYIAQHAPDLLIPSYTANGKTSLVAPHNIHLPDDLISSDYIVISAIDIKDASKAPVVKSSLGSGDNIYMGKNSLYITGSFYPDYKDNAASTITKITKYDIKSGISNPVNGQVDGRTLNQYSMDEYNGYFRIATSADRYNRRTTSRSSGVYVLDSSLNKTGEITGIAEGEDLKSARFMENMCYLITFLNTDPLFVLDLSNPANPVKKGELKIPGFSTFLQPWKNGTLIGIGSDADEITGRTNGIKLSLFDVKNPLNPTELSKYIFPDATYSEAQNNPKAILVSQSKNIFAFPVSAFETTYHVAGGYGYSYEQQEYYAVFGISNENEFVLRSNLNFEQSFNQPPSVRRGVYIGNTFFTLTDKKITSYSMTNFEKIQELAF